MPIQSAARIAIPVQDKLELAPPGATSLDIEYVKQTEANWCWAACGEMLFGHRQIAGKTQCALASSAFSLACCPSPRAPRACDLGYWPHQIYPNHGLQVTFHERPLAKAEVQQELAAGRPVQVCYNWSGGNTTHVALIVGERNDGKFEVLDPSPLTSGTGARDFDYIVAAYGKGRWIYSFTF